ncbi:MAG: DivIVA domain-containing protein, partial [Euzebyales bacterium]|nr:DivIVA domain-containing protein [Euzebyales bacterium]
MLTPEEIAGRDFLVSLRGYDRDEVRTFLRRVAEEAGDARARTAELEQQVERLGAERAAALADRPEALPASIEAAAIFAEIGQETQRILEAAQEAGAHIRHKARMDADRELHAARAEAGQVINDSRRRREDAERILAELREARVSLAEELRAVGRALDATLESLSPREPAGSGEDPRGMPQGADTDTPQPPETEAPPPPGTETPPVPETEKRQEAEAPPDRVEQAEDAEVAGATPPSDLPVVTAVDDDRGEGMVRVIRTRAVTPGTAVEAEPSGDGEGDASDPHALRDAALALLHPKLVRTVKRGLQEVHNFALDRVRRAKGQA